MTDKSKQVTTLTFFEADDDGQIQMALDLPEDYDPDNLRSFEIAALMVVQYLEEATDGFESISPH